MKNGKAVIVPIEAERKGEPDSLAKKKLEKLRGKLKPRHGAE